MKIHVRNYAIGAGEPLLLLSGPCVIENLDLCRRVAEKMVDLCASRGINYVFKASFDKANRTSLHSSRGPGLGEGLEVLARIKAEFSVPVTTDVHESNQCLEAAEVVDVLQIPAFLCRQTDLLLAAGEAAAKFGGAVNVKKGQFLRPQGMEHAVKKVRSAGCANVFVTERGTTFGYDSLVVDFRSLEIMRQFAPVCFDATHSVQKPGGGGDVTTGEREFVPALVRAAMAVGIDALFIETHPTPDSAASDGPNMVPLDEMAALLDRALAVRAAAR
ncbi:MAG TPA: 3-deoxy-8-phosphooctulonate synthase [Abditibacterium sp.]|jgi:2-dehydro-3-deoxyphosphooctonate aldolase (KDO 8-P synthase)